MKKQPVIAVIGAGALGVMFGQRMTQTLGPQRVFFAADAQRAARYAAQSFTCNGAACTFRFVTPQQALPAALAVFAVKSTGLAAAIETMRPFIGPETLVISLLNGITSEGELAAAYGTEHVLYCVAQGMDAVKDGPAVTYRNMGKLLIGSGTGARTPAVDAAAALLLKAVGRLSARERQIMELRFGLSGGAEHTQKEVADMIGISQSYISRLEKRIIKRLKGDLERIS